MKTITKNVSDLDAETRSALERVLGDALADSEQILLSVQEAWPASTAPHPLRPQQTGCVPTNWKFFEGLSDEEIAAIDTHIVRDHSYRRFE
jgi:hypothetical protein